MPVSWLDNLYERSDRCSTVEEELERLKYWVQDVSNEVDRFIEETEYEDDTVSITYLMGFIRGLQAKLEEKKNTIMGYK